MASLAISGGSSPSDIELLPLRVGDVLTLENVRACIQALYDSGRYSFVEVDANAANPGTALTFRVRPLYFFSTFRMEPERLLDRSISALARLPYGERFSQTATDRIAADIQGLLQTEGYFDASVTAASTLNETTHLASVVFRATTRGRARVGTIRIEGADATFTAKELSDAFALSPGEEYSADKLETGLRRIREKFINLEAGSFLNTRIETTKSYATSSRLVDLTLGVTPGLFTLVEAKGYGISQNKLKQLVPIFEEGVVDPDLIEEGANRILAFLQQEGYFEAVVRPERIDAPLDNAVQINYDIEKQEKHQIRSIRIQGNSFFSERDLRSRLQIRPAGFKDPGTFSPQLLESSAREIERAYRDAGFQGTVVERSFSERDHAIDISLTIDEGRRLPIVSVSFLGNERVPAEELMERSGLHSGEIYTPVLAAEARNTLATMYYYKGYPEIKIDLDARSADGDEGMGIVFRISEGAQYTIGTILVSGNTLTQEKIIHRNSNLYPNTPYNPEAILESQQRLYATGLFTRVDIVPLDQGLTGVRNLLIQVEDAKPVLFAYGFGYQQDERVRVTLEVTHANLFGQDRSSTVRLRGSPREQRLQWTYREPRLFNRNLDGLGSFFFEQSDRKLFKATRWDFSLQTLKRLSASESFLITAGYQTVNLRDIRVNPRAGEFPEEAGIIQISRIGTSYVRDRRDEPLSPKRGLLETMTFQIASRALGSEVNFTSLFNQLTFYRPLKGAVLANSLRFGWNQPFGRTTQLPITERYFAGGSTSLRGFDVDQAGPEGGGNALAIANMEYRFPMSQLGIQGLGGALFYDTGNVFRTVSELRLQDFTHTGGAGIRYNTPLGPVRFDIGVNLHPQTRTDGKREARIQFFFTLGHTF